MRVYPTAPGSPHPPSTAPTAPATAPQITKEVLFRIEGGSEEAVSARLALWRELTGPVVAVDCVRGYLVVAVGPRLELHYKQARGGVLVSPGVESARGMSQPGGDVGERSDRAGRARPAFRSAAPASRGEGASGGQAVAAGALRPVAPKQPSRPCYRALPGPSPQNRATPW